MTQLTQAEWTFDDKHPPGRWAEGHWHVMTSKESSEYQLGEWVEGRYWHNTVRDECCPDFACCRDDGAEETPRDARERFRDATDSERNEMLMMFLGSAMSSLGARVHIAGDEANYRETQ